jgi:glutamate dehydrogenase
MAFKKYIHGMLDLLNAHKTPKEIVDYMGGKEDIIFCGPDENTSDLMDWACTFAKVHDGIPYRFWKAFTTGKGFHLGGIPHDSFAMTTRGVRAYVQGLQRKFGLLADGSKPSDDVDQVPKLAAPLTKIQIGGPDGDLGSNEIKLANEDIIGVVDGSGVLFDNGPGGINRAELVRLAEARIPVSNFNRSLLSPNGYLVLIGDNDIKLPSGEIISSGLDFRNNFHLRPVSADCFIPCGGRPAAVNADNVQEFLYGKQADGSATDSTPKKLRFRFIVEGANLFFTNEARLAIEAAGIPIFKDSSANKGGVTSSSLEVLAALILNDEEFAQHMCPPVGTSSPMQGPGPVHDSKSITAGGSTDGGAALTSSHIGLPSNLPPFYKTYVKEIQRIIKENAELEFECLFREHAQSATPYTILSQQLSSQVVGLSDKIEKSETLWNNERLRNTVLESSFPPSLLNLVGGYQEAVRRLPESYLRARFASRLASRFVYSKGISSDQFSFFTYVEELLHGDASAL